MIPLNDIRKTEVRMPDGCWLEIRWEQLEVGDIIRMFEPDGTPVTYKGETEFFIEQKAMIRIEVANPLVNCEANVEASPDKAREF